MNGEDQEAGDTEEGEWLSVAVGPEEIEVLQRVIRDNDGVETMEDALNWILGRVERVDEKDGVVWKKGDE